MNAAELKAMVPIESILTHYGASLTARGEGRCLFPEHHNQGDRHPSMRVKYERVRCWSQNCFGDKGVDVFGLVAVMESLPTFGEQRRRVLEIVGLRDNGSEPQRRPSAPKPWRFNWRRTAATFEDHALTLWLRAESVLASAKGMNTHEWTDGDFDVAMNAVIRAHRDIKQSEFLEEVAFDLRLQGLRKEEERHATRSLVA